MNLDELNGALVIEIKTMVSGTEAIIVPSTEHPYNSTLSEGYP